MYSKKNFNSLIYHMNKRIESSSQGWDCVKDPLSVVVEVGVKSDRIVALWSCKTQQEPLWTIRWWLIIYQSISVFSSTVEDILRRLEMLERDILFCWLTCSNLVVTQRLSWLAHWSIMDTFLYWSLRLAFQPEICKSWKTFGLVVVVFGVLKIKLSSIFSVWYSD